MTHPGEQNESSCSRVSGSDINFSSVVTFSCLLLLSDRIRSQKQKISLGLQGRNSEFLKKPWEWLRKSNIILIGIPRLDCLWLACPFYLKAATERKEVKLNTYIYIYICILQRIEKTEVSPHKGLLSRCSQCHIIY